MVKNSPKEANLNNSQRITFKMIEHTLPFVTAPLGCIHYVSYRGGGGGGQRILGGGSQIFRAKKGGI